MPEINAASLPVNLPAQKIGPNDLISVSVYDSPEFTRAVRVGADGNIRFPMLKATISAQGKFPGEMEVLISKALETEDLIVHPYVSVAIIEYHSRPISVAGAVRKPLTFQAASPVTLLDALTRAEGLSQDAGGEILVTRAAGPGGGSYVQRIPVKGLIDAADPDLNVILSGGEEVRVPDVGRVYVVGNVRKPGSFAMRDASEATVLKMLAFSEGLLPFAGRQAYIYRREGGTASKNEIPIELKKIMDRKAPDVALQANDILYVPDNSGRRAAMTVIERVLSFGSTAGATALVYR